MSFLDRVVGFTLGLLCGLAAILTLAVALGWQAGPSVGDVLYTMATRAWETGLSAIVLLLAGLRLVAASLPRTSERAIVRETPLGQVRVSLRAIEHAVNRSVSSVKGVRDCDVDVDVSAAGVEVKVSIAVVPDHVIPDLADEAQRNVERYLREIVGIAVAAVGVEIKAMAGESKARVE